MHELGYVALLLISQMPSPTTGSIAIDRPAAAGEIHNLAVSNDGVGFAFTYDQKQTPESEQESAEINAALGMKGRLIVGQLRPETVTRVDADVRGRTYVSFLSTTSVFYSSYSGAAIIVDGKQIKVPHDQWKDPWLRPKISLHSGSNCVILAFEKPDTYNIDGPIRGTLMRLGLNEFKASSTAATEEWEQDLGSIVATQLSQSGSEVAAISATRHRTRQDQTPEPIWDYHLKVLKSTNGAKLWDFALPNDIFAINSIVDVQNDSISILALSASERPVLLRCRRNGLQEWRPKSGKILDAVSQRLLIRTDSNELKVFNAVDSEVGVVLEPVNAKAKAALSLNGSHVITLTESPQALSIKTFPIK